MGPADRFRKSARVRSLSEEWTSSETGTNRPSRRYSALTKDPRDIVEVVKSTMEFAWELQQHSVEPDQNERCHTVPHHHHHHHHHHQHHHPEDANVLSQTVLRRPLNIPGRGDFVGGIDNEALDFSQLEDFINSDSEQPATYFADTLAHNENGIGGSGGGGGGTIPSNHNVRVEGRQPHPHSQPPTRLHSPVAAQNHGNPTACNASGSPALAPVDTSYKNSQSYVFPHALPESPPDSGSEPPYSPPGHHEAQHVHSPHRKTALQDILSHPQQQQQQQHQSGNTTNYPTNLLSPSTTNTSERVLTSTTDPLLLTHPVLKPLLIPPTAPTGNGMPSIVASQQQQQQQQIGASMQMPVTHHEQQNEPSNNHLYSSLQPAPKKRKLSQNGLVYVKQEPELGSMVEHSCSSNSSVVLASSTTADSEELADNSTYIDASYQCIRFHPFQQTSWHVLCDHNLKELSVPHYRVDADKGFNFSNSDDAFVCQKKNHFQITCHAQLQGEPVFVRTGDGLKKIHNFQLHFYGVKVESPSQTIRVEQSQSDRSKKPFHPVTVELSGERVTKVTVGRLHFSETTSNNMRKKGKPNPDQRYFHLVVGLHAHTTDQTSYQVVAHASERIIVRASNPGQFETEGSGVGMEGSWQRGSAPDSVYHAGRVGINTDRPDEALVVHGNMKVTGHIVQPSDARAKENVQELDTREQLRNVQQLRVVRYRYAPEFALHSGLGIKAQPQEDTGVIAQEVQRILPEAVLPAGDIVLPNGQRIENFLVVNKERIFMENVGAVKELCKVTDSLETRIDQLERINKRLARLKRGDSLKSSISTVSSISSTKYTSSSGVVNSKTALRNYIQGNKMKRIDREEEFLCSNKFIQIVIVILILIMAFCLVAMATLYFLEYQKRNNIDWSAAAIASGGNGMLAIRPVYSPSLTSVTSTLAYDYGRKSGGHNSIQPLHGTLSPVHGKHLSTYSRTIGSDRGRLDDDNTLLSLSTQPPTPPLPPPNTKQQLYSQEITWYPIGSVVNSPSGAQLKIQKNNEFPGNWLSRNSAAAAASGVVPSNIDENEQATDVDTPLHEGSSAVEDNTNRVSSMITLGRPADCSIRYSKLKSSCQVYCCSTEIHHLEEPRPDHPPERKSILDHLEQPLNVHEEKHKSSKDFQNGIGPSVDPSTQTLVKETNYKYLHKRARARREASSGDWGEVASNAAGSLPVLAEPPETRPQLFIAAKSFNATLDHRYCALSSPHTPNNISCVIPLSKHMPDTHLTLHFTGVLWYWQIVQECPPPSTSMSNDATIDEGTICNWDSYTHRMSVSNGQQQQEQRIQYTESINQPSDQAFPLDVAHYLKKSLRYRVPTVQPSPQENICDNKHSINYLEFTLHFYRDCNE